MVRWEACGWEVTLVTFCISGFVIAQIEIRFGHGALKPAAGR
jgi:hypothetical protein